MRVSFLRSLRAVVAAGVLTAAMAVPALAAEKVTFSWLPTSDSMPFFVAMEEKMFEAEGIEVEAYKFQAPSQVVDSFVSGRSEVGPSGTAAGIALIAEAQLPGTLRFFGFTGGENQPTLIMNNALVVAKGSAIQGFADLKGKKLGTLPGIQWRTISRYIVRKAGLDPDKDIQLVELALPLQTQALIAGTVDALLSIEPMVSIALATGEVKILMENPAQRFIGDPFWGGTSAVTAKFLKERPAVARKVMAVMNAATAKLQGNFDKYRPLLNKYAGVPENALPLVKPILWHSESQITERDLDGFQAFANMLKDEGAMAAALDVRKLMVRMKDLP